MQRFHLGLLIAALPAAALSLLLLGCGPDYGGREGKRGAATISGQQTDQSGGTGKAKALVGTSYDATVKGKIVYKGSPDKAKLDKLTAEYRKQLATDTKHCLTDAPDEEKVQLIYQVADSKVGNVFVWLEAPDQNSFIQVPDDQIKEYADGKKNVLLTQPHCTFVPRCFVLFPSAKDKEGKEKLTGQKLEVENNARIPHNSKFKGPGKRNQGDTGLMGPGVKYGKQLVLQPTRDVVNFECNIHNWMRAYARVFDHPYAAVSKNEAGPEFGTFAIANAPVGVPLKLKAWHEDLGNLKTSDQPITLKPGETVLDVEFLSGG